MKFIVRTALLGLLAWGAVTVIERVIFAQAPQYPVWLATGTIQMLTPRSLAQLRAQACGGQQPIDVYENRQQFLLRCGLWWPQSKTWIVPRTPTNTAILQDPAAF